MNKGIRLKDGRRVRLVALAPDDVERLHNLLTNMSDDDTKWSMAPYQREWVQRWLCTPTLIQIAAERRGKIVGFSCIEAWAHPKRMGTGYLGAYVHRDYRGSELFSSIIGLLLDEARERKLHKLGTEVVSESTSAISIFEGHGFQVEGRKKDCFRGTDGRYYDTVILGKILN